MKNTSEASKKIKTQSLKPRLISKGGLFVVSIPGAPEVVCGRD